METGIITRFTEIEPTYLFHFKRWSQWLNKATSLFATIDSLTSSQDFGIGKYLLSLPTSSLFTYIEIIFNENKRHSVPE